MFFFTLFLWVVAFVLSEVLRPKPKNENARPASLGDFTFPTATEGRVVPVVWGTVKLSGPNVIWYGDLQAKAIKKKMKTGIFSSTQVLQGYKYYVGIQFALCRGVVDHLKKIWIGEDIVFDGTLGEAAFLIDEPELFGGEGVGNGGVKGTFRFYRGTRTQASNSYLAMEPAPFLWHDDYTEGEEGDVLQLYKKTEDQQYYRVSDNGSVGGFGPSNNLEFPADSNIYTAIGLGTERHVRSAFTGASPGDIHKYCAMLVHSERPRLSDRIKVSMTFEAKAPGLADGDAHALWMGCKCQDLSPRNSEEGVFCIVEDNETITVRFQSPSTSGAYILMHTLSVTNGDFATLTGRHEVEMHVSGGTVSVLVDGLLKWTSTDSRITTIDESNQGFCIGIEGNANVQFFSAVNWTSVGIYTFGIDSLDRVLTSSVPAYRGTCHGVLEKGYVGNSTSISPWSFEVERIDEVNTLGVTDGKHRIQQFDLNPMCVLYEILTDTDWGLAFTSSQIDLTNFRACAATLYDENNGFSMVLDNPLAVQDLIAEIERQIDGYLYCDRVTGKWKVTLAREDYVLVDLDLADESNVQEVRDFTRGSWEETTNNVQVEYTNRGNAYGTSYGMAQDMANIRLQQNSVVSVTEKYSGVKNKKNANRIAWRDLRALAYPLAKATLVVDRTFHDKNPGDVIRWSDSRRNIENMPMRIQRVDLGQLDAGSILLNLIQDIFGTDDPSFADPDNSQWIIPRDVRPLNIEDADRLIFEAPRKFVLLAPENPEIPNRVWVGARPQEDGASRFDLVTQVDAADYVPAGSVEGFLYAGSLDIDMLETTISGTSFFDINPDPDNLIDLVSELANSTPTEIGTTLSNLLLVGDEIIAFETFAGVGDVVTFTKIWRGLLDTVPAAHPAGTRVWLICVNGNLTDIGYGGTDVVNVKLLPQNRRGQLDQGVASPTPITLANRYLRPYPPTNLIVNGVPWDDAVSLDFDTTGLTGGTPPVTLIDEPFTYSNGALATATSSVWTEGTYYGSIYNDSGLFINSNRIILPAYGNDGSSLPQGTEAWANHPDTASLDVTLPYEVSSDITLTTLDPDEYKADTVVLNTDTPSSYTVGNAYDIDGSWTTPAKITVDSRAIIGGTFWHITSYHLSTVGRTALIPANPVHIANDIPNFTGTTFDVTYVTATPADGVLYSGTCGLVVEYDDTYPDVGLSVKVGYFPVSTSVTIGTIGVDDTSASFGPGFVLYVNYKNTYYAAADVSAAVSSGVSFNLKVVVDDARLASIQIDDVEFATALLDAADVAFSNMGLYFNTSTIGDFNSRGIPDIVADNFLLIQSGTVEEAAIDDAGLKFDFTRRDWRNLNEVLALNESSLPGDFPTANLTEYSIKLYKDPAGTDTLFYTSPWNMGVNTISVRRTDILRTAHEIPADIRVEVITRHVLDSVTWESRYNLRWDFSTASSSLSGGFNWDVLDTSEESAAFTATSTGTYTLDIGTALATGLVQVKINAGAYTTIVAATTLTGTFAVTTGDVIKIKHTEPGGTDTFTGCFLRKETGAVVAYAILSY